MMVTLLLGLAMASEDAVRQQLVPLLSQRAPVGAEVVVDRLDMADSIRECLEGAWGLVVPNNAVLARTMNVFVQSKDDCGGRIQAEITVWVEVPVADNDVVPGDAVVHNTARVALHEVRGRPVEMGQSWVASRRIHKGEALSHLNVRRKPDIKRGDPVTVVARTRALQVSSEGHAMSEGFIGEEIRVWNPATNRAVTGRLGPNGAVEVGGKP